jgi:hypothetical protein
VCVLAGDGDTHTHTSPTPPHQPSMQERRRHSPPSPSPVYYFMAHPQAIVASQAHTQAFHLSLDRLFTHPWGGTQPPESSQWNASGRDGLWVFFLQIFHHHTHSYNICISTHTHTHTHHRRELTHGREDLDRQGTDRQRIMALKRVNKELQDISK